MLRRILTVMLTGGAAAGPFEEGADTFERGDYTTALRLWRLLAEQGDADAQLNRGLEVPS
jgi:TPR repeat protein